MLNARNFPLLVILLDKTKRRERARAGAISLDSANIGNWTSFSERGSAAVARLA
jgi:hypothetical protein